MFYCSKPRASAWATSVVCNKNYQCNVACVARSLLGASISSPYILTWSWTNLTELKTANICAVTTMFEGFLYGFCFGYFFEICAYGVGSCVESCSVGSCSVGSCLVGSNTYSSRHSPDSSWLVYWAAPASLPLPHIQPLTHFWPPWSSAPIQNNHPITCMYFRSTP